MSNPPPLAELPAVDRPAEPPASGDGSGPAPSWRATWARGARRHAAFLTVLGVALAVRTLIMVAYPRAFWYQDSARYMLFSYRWEPDFARQYGYSLMLKVLRQTGSLYSVSAVQHLLGLAVAAAVYSLLQRRNVPRWASILAVVPVLFDSIQLGVEHHVLAESAFTTLVVGGLLALLWPARPSMWSAGLAGLLFALSAMFRIVSLPLVAVTIAYLVIRRVGWRPCVAYAACAALPLVGYAVWFQRSYNEYSLSTMEGTFLYGRVAPVAECEGLPPHLLAICPGEPVGERNPRSDWYIWNERSPRGDASSDLQEEFAATIATRQPLDVAGAIAAEVGWFLLPHTTHPYWTCAEAGYLLPAVPPRQDYDFCRPNPRQDFSGRGNDATMPGQTPLTDALGTYARVSRTPRLVLGASVLVVLAALAWRPRRRIAGAALSDVGLLAGWGGGLLVLAVAGSTFDERYGVPALAVLPAAGVLALRRLHQASVGRPMWIRLRTRRLDQQ